MRCSGDDAEQMRDKTAARPAVAAPCQITRRSLLAGGPALFGTGRTPAIAAAVADTPGPGGTMRVGLGGGSTTDTLDPRAADDSVMIATNLALYNCLVENGPDNRPIPELAEHVEPAAGATEWILTLRQDVAFHNGKLFDADDAIYSLNLHRGETVSGAAGPMKAISDIRKLDPHRIAITLAGGDADFPTVLTDYHIVMVPNGFADWAHPVGTGAFTLEHFDPGVRVAFRKAGPYWKPGRGHLDAVEFTVINATNTRMNALITGQVDAINRADPRTVSRIEKSPFFEIVRAAGAGSRSWPCRSTTRPSPASNCGRRSNMRSIGNR